jgi:hypothetical protein
MLENLKAKLTESEQMHREEAFQQATDLIARAEAQGGLEAPVRKSYPTRARGDGRRVDIEILRGRAFLPQREGKRP